ncbi:MAG: glycoside hydrolase family 16 protein [Verrucomicrobiae bacterium]|nr:glycoside hydrolase family 16 protein [Verrucomicrobiae bacterium]
MVVITSSAALARDLPPLPTGAKLVLEEDWSEGRIDPARWYLPRKKWGQGNHGVSPENVRIEREMIAGKERHILVCQANGDLYDGPVIGYEGRRTRVGGIVVTRGFFASGRYEVVMKIGGVEPRDGGPADPMRPKGAVPAVWTYGYRYVTVTKEGMDSFHAGEPLYNPHLKAYGVGANEYWSELDFPEFGKGGDFDKALYNTFLQNKHQPRTFEVKPMIDGRYHTLTTEWRTKLVPIEGVSDSQVVEKDGYHWVHDRAVPFDQYLGNPLKRLGKDRYAVHAGDRAVHYLDGVKVAENPTFVPSMAAQLNLGVWLPGWGGPAPWKQSTVSFGPVRIWQYFDPGDVRGILIHDIDDTFEADGAPLKK